MAFHFSVESIQIKKKYMNFCNLLTFTFTYQMLSIYILFLMYYI